MSTELKPCPFCGGPVELERATPTFDRMHGHREWWGVICRNTLNLGGTCAIQQTPSASKEAAVERWNMRAKPSCEEGSTIDLAGHKFDGRDLLQRAMRNIRGTSRYGQPRWVLVKHVFALGSTCSRALCHLFDLDPDEELKK